MARVFTTIPVEQKPKSGGGGPRPPRVFDGGGWGGGGRGDSGRDRLRRARLGMVLAMVAILMLFVSLSSLYVARLSPVPLQPGSELYVRTWPPLALPVRLLIWNTLLLLASSGTLELARRRMTLEAAGWNVQAQSRSGIYLGATLLLGCAFLAGQAIAWRRVTNTDSLLTSTPSNSFFYVLTGTHAVHLAGGVLAVLIAAVLTMVGRARRQRRTLVEVTAIYWHFMAALWLYLFALLYWIR